MSARVPLERGREGAAGWSVNRGAPRRGGAEAPPAGPERAARSRGGRPGPGAPRPIEEANPLDRAVREPLERRRPPQLAAVPHEPHAVLAEADRRQVSEKRRERQDAIGGRGQVVARDGLDEVEGPRARPPQRGEVAAGAEALAQVAGERADVGAGRAAHLELDRVASKREDVERVDGDAASPARGAASPRRASS